MECNCGLPVRMGTYKDGRACYSCAYGVCRFFGFAPVQCEGYQRIIATNTTPAETCIVRFEALLHPLTHDPAIMASVQTPNEVAGKATEDGVRSLLEEAAYSPSFHVARRSYLYAMEHYAILVAKLRAMPHVLVQEIPTFFFRSIHQTKELPKLFAEAVASREEAPIDTSDFVFTQLKGFQQKGVEFVVSHGGRGMIADDMGLGKTVQSIAICHHYRAEWPVLVVCPMSLLENWAKEFNRFCSIPFSRIAVLQGTKARAEPLHEVVIVSYSSLKCVEGGKYKVVVLDESHYIKAGDTKRTQLALKLCAAAQRVVLLSGTPTMSRPMELYTQLSAIHARMVPTKTQYAARYCNGHLGRFGMDYQGHSHIDELHYLLQDFVIRRTKKELSEAELPSKSRQLLYVYITAKEKKSLEKQVMALRRSVMDRTTLTTTTTTAAGGGGDYGSRAPNAFELKIATARAKIPAVQDYVTSVVEQHLESGEKIIFFAHHQCMMEAIKSAVVDVRPREPVDYIYITGETPASQREQLATHFRQEPTCTVAILSMGSSGTGHNFTCASTVVFAELDWNPSTHLQCEDRVHRMGQSNACTIKYLLADGTSDDVVWPMLETKLTVTSAVLESSPTMATHVARLSENADKQNVSRRDVSLDGAAATQSTLDGFLKNSTGASQATPRSDSVSASGATNAPASARTPVGAAVPVDGDEESDVELLPSQGDDRSGVAPVGNQGASPVRPQRQQSGTFPTPPSPDEDTQAPQDSPAHDPRRAPPPSSSSPPPPPHMLARQGNTNSPAAAETPLVISIAELRKSPHLLRPNLPGGHRARHSGHLHPQSGRTSQGHSSGARASSSSGLVSTPVGTTTSNVSGASVLDLMVKKKQQHTGDDDAVVLLGEAPAKNNVPSSVRAVAMPTSTTTTRTPAQMSPDAAAALAARHGTLAPQHHSPVAPPSSSLPTTSSGSAPENKPIPHSRRTTFTFQPTSPPTAVAPPSPVPARAEQPQPMQLAPSSPSPATPSPRAPHTVAHIPVNFMKRPRSSAGGGEGHTKESKESRTRSPPRQQPQQQAPPYDQRGEPPAPAVILSASASTATATTGTGKRTIFRFTTSSSATGGGASHADAS